MDSTDIKIINLLQENCKISTREIGRAVGLTAPAAAERIRRLREKKIISGFRAEIDDSLLGSSISAFVQINVPPRDYERFCLFCSGHPAVVEHHHIVGLNNALLKIRVGSSKELDSFLKQIRSYGLSNTSVILSSYFTHKNFPEGAEEAPEKGPGPQPPR